MAPSVQPLGRDVRAAPFVLVSRPTGKVEAEAIDPTRLRALIEEAVADYWDDDAYQAVLRKERADRRRLRPRQR